MGKGLLIIVAALGLLGTYHSLQSKKVLYDTGRYMAEQQFEVLARNAAVTGYNRVKQELAEANCFDTFSGTIERFDGNFEGVQYTATIQAQGPIATVRSVGKTVDATGKEIEKTIRAEVKLQTPVPDAAPPFLQYALLSDEDLSMNGSIQAEVFPGLESARLNANMHTNSKLRVHGSPAVVRGFGSYTGTALANPAFLLESTFQPNYNPDGRPSVYRADKVELPTFPCLSKVEVDRVSEGNVRITSPVNLGSTRQDPFVWHIKGDLTITGNASMVGYMMFIVDGDINIRGNVLAAGGADEEDLSLESNLAFYAVDDVNVSGNVRVFGQIFALGDLVFSGGPEIYGSMATSGETRLNGNVTVYYRKPSPVLSTLWSDKTELVLTSYLEE